MNDTLPYNIEAEKALLGAIISHNEVMEKVVEYLQPYHFAIPEHGRIFDTCRTMIDEGKEVNNVTLGSIFKDDPDLAAVGGLAYLAELISSAITIINAGEYGKIIYDLHQKRELIHLGENITEASRTQQEHSEIIEEIERSLTVLTDDNSHEIGTPISQMSKTLADIEEAYRGDRPPGIPTGFPDIDRRIGNLRPGKFIVIAGRPSMGKSALVGNIAEEVSGEEPVMFFSPEMDYDELDARRISYDTNIDFDKIYSGRLTSEEMKAVVASGRKLELKPFFIDDAPAPSIHYIRRQARKQMRKTGLGVIVVDYIQLMTGEGNNRDGEVSSITRGLKALAKELHCTIIGLSQLNREVERRPGCRPQLSDLRESGSIEQDADVVMFVYRAEYYLERQKPSQKDGESVLNFGSRCEHYYSDLEESRGKAEVMLAKVRQGRVGTIELGFDGAHMKFISLDHHNIER